jgi:hypothetical protein
MIGELLGGREKRTPPANAREIDDGADDREISGHGRDP